MKANIVESVTQTFGTQYAGLLFRVHFEYALPGLQIGNERFELKEIDASVSRFLEMKIEINAKPPNESNMRRCTYIEQRNHLTAYIDTGTALDVIIW